MEQKGNPNQDTYWQGKIDAKLDGICDRIDGIEIKVGNIEEKLVNGGDKNPGIISQVRENTRWRNKLEKGLYALGAFIIFDIVVRIMNSSLAEEIFHNTP